VDWLRHESVRLSQQVCTTFDTSQQAAERAFLGGEPAHLFLHVKDVILVESQDEGAAAFKLDSGEAAAKLCHEAVVAAGEIVTELRNCTLRLLQHQLKQLGDVVFITTVVIHLSIILDRLQ
jgi:hypothetical protein